MSNPAVSTYDQFTDEAKHALNLAREASFANDTGYLDEVHLFIGCCRARDSIAVRMLVGCGVDPERLCLEAKERAAKLRRDPSGTRQLPFTTSAKRVLEVAVEEAFRSEHTSIGTHHLILGLLQGDSATANILRSTGVSLESARNVACRLQTDVEPPHAPELDQGVRSEVAVLREAFDICFARNEFEAASVLRDLIHKLEHPR